MKRNLTGGLPPPRPPALAGGAPPPPDAKKDEARGRPDGPFGEKGAENISGILHLKYCVGTLCFFCGCGSACGYGCDGPTGSDGH